MGKELLRKNKKKIAVSATLGILLILSVVFAFMDIRKMDVEGSETLAEQIAAVQAELTSLSADGTITLNVPVENPTGKVYRLVNEYDWMALMVLSYNNDLTGYTFYIDTTLDLRTITVAGYPFMGIGLNSEYPFSGDMYTTLGENSTSITVNCALFGYLDASAGINRDSDSLTLDIVALDATAGLAQVLTGSGTVTEKTFSNIYIRGMSGSTGTPGTVVNASGAAGGVFGQIVGEEESALVIESLGIHCTIASVQGIYAGGIAGKVSGNVELHITNDMVFDGVSITNVKESGASVGSLIGRVEGTSDSLIQIIVEEELTFAVDIENSYYYAGGLFGYVKYADVEFKNHVTIGGTTGEDGTVNSGTVRIDNESDYYAGGVFGYLGYSSVTVADGCTVSVDAKINGRAAGGFAAYIVNCDEITIPVLKLKTIVSDCGSMGSFVAYSMYSKVNIDELVICEGTELIAYAGYAGGVIGRDEGSYYTLPTVTYESAITVTSKYKSCTVGGFAGTLTNTKLILTNPITTNGNTVTSETTSAEGDQTVFVGGLIGKYECENNYNRVLEKLVSQNTILYAAETDYPTYVGGVIGAVAGDSGITVKNCSATDVHIANNSNKMYAGGIVGGNFNDTLVITATDGNKVNVTLTKESTTGYFWRANTLGGIMGYAAADCEIEETVVLVCQGSPGSSATYAVRLGGVLGAIGDGVHVSLSNIAFDKPDDGSNNLTNVWDGSAKVGGIVGEIGSGAVLELNNEIDLTNLNNVGWSSIQGYYASIAGYQNNSLIYINPNGYSDGEYTYGLELIVSKYPDEVGNYGSVYRNGNWDTVVDDMMDTANWTIQESDAGEVSILGDSEPYTLQTVGDVLRLSIALNTENVFSGFDTTTYTCETLLSGDYEVSGAIDMSGTGMMTINKNHQNITSNMGKYAFKGTLTGTGDASITNTMVAAFQPYLGLFSAVQGAEISNLTINTSIEYLYIDPTNWAVTASYVLFGKQHAGGIAAYATDAVTLENVILNTNIQEESCAGVQSSFAAKNRYLGGAIGYYNSAANTTFTADTVTANVDINVTEMAHYAGGLVGYIITNDVAGAKVELADVTVTGALGYSVTGNESDVARVGGVIAVIGNDTAAGADSVDTKLTVTMEEVKILGVQIGDEAGSASAALLDCGGLVGYIWRNVDVTADGITVAAKDGTIPGMTTSMRSAGVRYGGLWHTVNGHMKLSAVDIQDMAISVSTGAQTLNNGLLIGNGQYLYLELDGYSLADDVTVSDAGALYLDEIVGYSQGSTVDDIENEECGGIISIRNTTAYDLYDNQIIAQSNPYTRYYYNLDTDLSGLETLSSSTFTIDSAEKMLQWSLAHYANTPLRQFLTIDTDYNKYGENITFSGNIDLEDTSFYPVTVSGGVYHGTDAVITFHGGDFDSAVTTWKNTSGNTEDRLRYIYENESEHYRLHSGVFYDVTTSTIQNLTLTGSVTAMSVNGIMYSGGLVAGSIYGILSENQIEDNAYYEYETTPTNIYNITLDNFSVSHMVADGWASYYGLLISRIDSGSVVNIGYEDATTHYNGVTMTGYTTDDKVAAALIGQVGHSTAEGINLSFVNMQVADVADGVSDSAAVGKDSEEELAGAKVFAYASFIYDYYYQLDNTNGIYIFYLEDYQNEAVTLGSEIGDTVQFYDDDIVTPIKDYTADSGNGCLAYDETNYKPYVYQSHGVTPKKEIDVNPKTGNITEGCGTYDSPYVIENANQLMTLYKYLKDYESNEKSLKGWEINEFGVDTVADDAAVVSERTYVKKHYNVGQLLDADDEPATEIADYDSLVAGGFPSVEQLSNAYYLITEDIDLSDATDFTGFGSDKLPFTGVFVGQKEDGTQPVLAMSRTTTTGGETTYGFIKYAKGAVVRNLQIELGNALTDDDAKVVQVSGTGAGVMAIVLGGDNVIDGVTVSGIMTTGLNTIAGGYVGDVQNGSVILRGMTATSLSGFEISAETSEDGETGAYQKVLAGKVQDGYLVDDDGSFANYVARTDMDATDTSNVADLDSSTGSTITDCVISLTETDTIGVTQTEADGYQYSLDSAQDLLVLSLAVNAGAMNYQGDVDSALLYGYDEYSRCRTADYQYVGNVVSDAAQAEYLKVIRYDNENPYTNDTEEAYLCGGVTYETSFYHPYIYEYFDFDDTVEIMQGTTLQSVSALNQYITDSTQAKYRATYQLAAGGYDMTAYGIKKGFKGIGARKNSNLCSLRGDFLGAGSDATGSADVTTITLDLDIATYRDAALFNTLYAGTTDDKCVYTIGGFNLGGTVKNTYNNDLVAAAGVTTLVYGKYDFEDICVKDMVIDCTNIHTEGTNPYNMAAGLVVRVDDYTSTEQKNTVNFTDCKLDDTTIQAINECGGFVAINEKNGCGNTFTRCVVENSVITTQNGKLGGFMGATYYPVTFTDCELAAATVTGKMVDGVTVGGNVTTGGFLGFAKNQVTFSDCDILNREIDGAVQVTKVAVEGYNSVWSNHCGGYVGYVEYASLSECHELKFDNCDIEALTLNQRTNGEAGGYVGKTAARIVINQAEGAKSTITDVTILRNFNQSTGGLAGSLQSFNYSYVEGYNSLIQNVDMVGLEIDYRRETDGFSYLGGIFGYSCVNTEMYDIRVLGTESNPTYLHYSVGSDKSAKLCIGGLAGNIGYAAVQMENCSVMSVDEDGEAADTCYTQIFGGRYAGGFLGNIENSATVTVVSPVVSQVQIQAAFTYSGTDSVSAPHGSGGGIAGKVESGTLNVQKAEIQSVAMENYDLTPATSDNGKNYMESTKTRTLAFGGIAGLVKSTLNVEGFAIDGLDIGEDGYCGEAGGVAGIADGGTVTVAKAAEEGAGANTITNSTIVAGVAGGVIGNTQYNTSTQKSGNVHIADVELENVTVLARFLAGSNWEIFAGGVTGRHQKSKNVNDYYENITMRNSVVSAYSTYTSNSGKSIKTYLGGFIGGQYSADSYLYDVYGYNITLDDVLIGQLKHGESETIVPIYSSVADGTTALYTTKVTYGTSASYAQEQIQNQSYVSENYLMNMGTMVGYLSGDMDSYIIQANVRYSEELTGFHPALDVGLSQTDILTLLQSDDLDVADAYEYYRDKYHIIYRDNFDGAVTSGFIAEQLGLEDYYFDKLDEVYDERFTGLVVDNNTDYRLERNYLQGDNSGNYPVNSVLEESYRTVEDGVITYLAPYVDSDGNPIPMLTASGNYNMDTIINTAINILTNNGGTSKSADGIMDVTITRYQLSEDNTTISPYNSQEAVISYADGVFMVSEDEYDTITDKTFNLVTVKYKYSDELVYELYIPVFVREMLSIETHMKAMEGSHYLLDKVPSSDTEPANGYTQINVELQSVYTLYTEFMYSSARAEYSTVQLEKSLYRKNNAGDYAPFEVGTKITLLDITGNNMAYYYEVTEENQSSVIKFSDFRSISDETYVNADLGKDSITDGSYETIDSYCNICNQQEEPNEEIGLEQFLIIIDESKITNVPAYAQYNLYVRAEEEDNETLFKNAKVKEPCYVVVNEIPGLYQLVAGSTEYSKYADSIAASGLGGNDTTYLTESSQISRDGMLQLIGSAYIISPVTVNPALPNYWEIADESSHERYVELAVSLIYAETNERVTIPEGTKIEVQLNGESYGDLFAYQAEYLYCYYDTLKNSGSESDYVNLNDLNSDMVINFDINFDFSSATDFSDISEANYYVKVELLGTSDYAYPRSGDTEDYVNTGVVKGINKKYLGFALETEDMLTLGMNDYNSDSSDSGRIGITSRLDFSDYLDSKEGKAELKSQFDGKYFTYTYVFERKTTDGTYADFGYEPGSRVASLVRIFDGNIPLEEISETGTEDDRVIISKTVQYTVDVSDEETEDSVEEDETEVAEDTGTVETVNDTEEDTGTEAMKVITTTQPIMEEEFTLFADVPQLMNTTDNITNYKVTCYVTVTDSAPDVTTAENITELVDNSNVSDFFIFTVARLKTDMD